MCGANFYAYRCGEVRVSIVANSEISLGDQVKDLNQRIKALEKQILLGDELRQRLEHALRAEKVGLLINNALYCN